MPKTYFPILIKYSDGTEAICHAPSEIISGKTFRVLKCNVGKNK